MSESKFAKAARKVGEVYIAGYNKGVANSGGGGGGSIDEEIAKEIFDILLSEKTGVSNGIAPLDAEGRISIDYLPSNFQGEGLESTADNQVVFGMYNDTSEASKTSILVIGNGYKDSEGIHRSNAFEVKENGEIYAGGELVNPKTEQWEFTLSDDTVVIKNVCVGLGGEEWTFHLANGDTIKKGVCLL